MRRRLLAATAAGVAAAALTACGDMHPGAAVVINDGDYQASMEEVDDLTAALCEASPLLAKASGQQGQTSAGVDARQYVTGLLVQSYVTPLAAEEAGVEKPSPAELEVPEDDYREVTDQMDEDRVDEFLRLLEVSNEVATWQARIGSEQPGSNPQSASQLGQQYVLDFADGLDIDIDPRLGLDGNDLRGEDVRRSGSMSVAESAEATRRTDPDQETDLVDSLPPSQSCG